MRTIAILNPAAGGGRAGKKQEAVEAALRSVGMGGEVWVTKAPGHAVALARQAAARAEVVLAIGGDGTVHHVSRGLIESASPAHLGVIPLGTGNDFVKMLGMARCLEVAARQLATARPTAVDYGVVRWEEGGALHERVFINAVGIGFDAHVAIEAEVLKGLRGATRYVAAVLRTLRHWEGPSVRITGVPAPDGLASVLFEGPLLLMTVGNGVCSGGMFYLTPRASIIDGLFDICLVAKASPWRILRMLPRVVKGQHEREPEVHTARMHSLQVTADTGIPVHADGEVLTPGTRTIDVEVVPGGLSVLTPGC